jgi:hypothetical protein
MSFNVLPFGSTPAPGNGPVAKPAQVAAHGASFAEVVDLASRRQAPVDTPEIPDHVWDEVEAASKLWQDLRSQDREVRFDTHGVTGRVVASLCDLDGGVVRPLPLREAFGIDDHGPGGDEFPPSAA